MFSVTNQISGPRSTRSRRCDPGCLRRMRGHESAHAARREGTPPLREQTDDEYQQGGGIQAAYAGRSDTSGAAPAASVASGTRSKARPSVLTQFRAPLSMELKPTGGPHVAGEPLAAFSARSSPRCAFLHVTYVMMGTCAPARSWCSPPCVQWRSSPPRRSRFFWPVELQWPKVVWWHCRW